jgi:hypothetical protein
VEIVPLDANNISYAVGLAEEMHKLSTFADSGPAFNWGHCKATMLYAMNHPDYYFTLAMDDGVYVGAVCGHVTPFYFSPDMLGVEEAWYVRDGTRYRASIGMRLMYGFVEWCLVTKRAVMVQSGDVAGIRTIGVDALYRRMGFTRYGAIYRYMREA